MAAVGQPGGPIRWSRWRGRLSAAAIVVVADVEAQILDEPVEQRGKVQRIPRRPRVVIAGQEPTGRGFIRGNQHANTLYLQRWLLSSGIVCRARFPPSTLPTMANHLTATPLDRAWAAEWTLLRRTRPLMNPWRPVPAPHGAASGVR